MRRVRVTLEEVADRENLIEATMRAAQNKRQRGPVRAFLARLDDHLAALREAILEGTVAVGTGVRFEIRDPKPRSIHAPDFPERVLHHALMRYVGPVLERSLVDDTYACRVGKGTLAAVQRAQHHGRRSPWYAKFDVRSYFARIDHRILEVRLRRLIQGEPVLSLIGRILEASPSAEPGRGLPIGTLTSQCFANAYLGPLDRFLLENQKVDGMIRYMDDVVVWTSSRAEARRLVEESRHFASEHLALEIKPTHEVNRSALGVTVCGYRVRPGSIRPSARRRRRSLQLRRACEADYLAGRINVLQLQRAYDAALAVIAHGEVRNWLRAHRPHSDGPDWRDAV